jgi:3-hydroxyacyl-[acyl-carrier-protein] dehydratase
VAGAIRDAAVGGIERGADGGYRRRYVFGADFPGFTGHFPGRPILPAVLQLMTACLLVEAATGQRVRLAAIERAKFVNTIVPGALVDIGCRQLAGASAHVWEFHIDANRKQSASFLLTLLPAADGA